MIYTILPSLFISILFSRFYSLCLEKKKSGKVKWPSQNNGKKIVIWELIDQPVIKADLEFLTNQSIGLSFTLLFLESLF